MTALLEYLDFFLQSLDHAPLFLFPLPMSYVPYKLSADPDFVEKLRRQYLSWYFSDVESYGSSENVSDISKSQIACPCSWLQARWERRYWFFTSKDNSFCYIERFPNIFGGAQECCYSRSSNSFGALVLQGGSSGGLLRYHPYWSWIINYPNYLLYDRNAQELCCLSSVGYCRFYHERRTPSGCTGYVPQRRSKCYLYAFRAYNVSRNRFKKWQIVYTYST